MKKYIKPIYENESIETTDIMNGSGIVSVTQDVTNSITNAATSLDELISKIEQSIRD